MKHLKFIPVILAFVFSACLLSCQNIEESLVDTSNESTNKWDKPIPSLFNNTRAEGSTQVLNGDCVIGCILFLAEQFCMDVTYEEVVHYFGNSYKPGQGIEMNSYDWDAAFNHWFNTKLPDSQQALINYIWAEGPMLRFAVCRLFGNRSHAVVIYWVEAGAYFWVYDPVGTEENGNLYLVEPHHVHDARIIEPKRY